MKSASQMPLTQVRRISWLTLFPWGGGLDEVPASEVTAHKTTAEIGDHVHKILSEGLAKRGVATAQPS